MDAIALPPLTLGRYQFDLTLEEPADLPAYLGGVLRGGFGFTFKRLVCMQPHLRRCTDCVLLHTCAYPAVFEPTPSPDTEVLRTHERIPVPYVFEPPARHDTTWQAGETLCFGLVLVGQGITCLPYFLLAFQELGRQGLGRHRRRAALSQVVAVEPARDGRVPLWEGENLQRDWAILGLWHAQDVRALDGTGSTLTLNFLTPTRLKYDGRYLQDAPPFHVVVRTLLRRVSSLAYFHAGHQWETDYRGWIARAKQVEIAAAHVGWMDWQRYSTRQQRHMNLGGVVGQVTYGGDVTPFLPLLRLGELIHVGKGAVFGNGQYELGSDSGRRLGDTTTNREWNEWE